MLPKILGRSRPIETLLTYWRAFCVIGLVFLVEHQEIILTSI